MEIFIKNYGCSTNLADGETLAGCLIKAGYKIVKSISEAKLVLYNTCAVKEPTENRIIESLKRIPTNKKLLIIGCLPLINFDRLNKEVRFDGVSGPAIGKEVVEVVNKIFSGEKIFAINKEFKSTPSLELPCLRSNNTIGIIPVSYGCLGSCSYCSVVFARGRLRSHSIQEIKDRLKNDLNDGVKEIWITAQDTACFGRDQGVTLTNLLNALLSIKKDFRLRIGMMTPNMVKDIQKDLMEEMMDQRVFKFLHLPVQSGDDQVLKLMQRRYSIEEFKEVIKDFKRKFPNLTLATDIICGLPGEGENEFKKTLKLIKDVKPDIVNISKFFPRPKTLAKKMKHLTPSSKEIKSRSSIASKLTKLISLENNKKWIGWSGKILIDEKGKVPESWVGRNYAYKPIVVKKSELILGKFVRVEIIKAFPTYLEGKLN